MQDYDQIKQKIRQLTGQIEAATDNKTLIALKRELYKTKLEALDAISQEEKRAGLTARELKAKVETKPLAVRYATGVLPLDEALEGGIETGTLVQLAGQSFTGKTHLTLEVLSNVAIYANAVMFNFEMGDARIVKRLNGLLRHEEQWDNLIIDADTRSLQDLVMEISLYAREGVRFFAIDSKMKIDVHHEKEDHKKFAAITKELSKLVQQKEIIVFLINQMNEEDIKNKRLAFKGSGDQMYDTDIALFYTKSDDDLNRRTLICPKNRQDEKQFSIDLMLDGNGKTVSAGEGYKYKK
ncbi:MAG: AAA family ATPase [Sulfurimonadaceae bacterium]